MTTGSKFYLIGQHGLEPCNEAALAIGQIVWLNGYGENRHFHDRRVIFEKEETRYGIMYSAINIDSDVPAIQRYEAHTIRPVEQLFGIGIYYTPGDMYEGTAEELAEIAATAREQARHEAERLEAERKEEERLKQIGCEVWKEMQRQGAASLITASFQVDESEPMTDSFSTSAKAVIVIGASDHTRNLFSELRNVAAGAWLAEVAALSEAPKTWEHRENWSGGAGYFIARNRWAGWRVQKCKSPGSREFLALGRQHEEVGK